MEPETQGQERLQSFLQTQIQDFQRFPAPQPPNPAICLQVDKLAPLSVAGLAGIQPGDLLVTINGGAAGSLDPKLHRTEEPETQFVFFNPERGEIIRLETSGIDLGFTLKATPEAVEANFVPASSDFELLLILWKAGRWAALEKLCRECLPKTGIMSRLFGGGQSDGKSRNSPALVLLGAALWEQGKREEGAKLIDEYDRDYVSSWTLNYRALTEYYQARQYLETGENEDALDLLGEAFLDEPFPQIASLIEQLTGERPMTSPHVLVGQPIPVEYRLRRLDGAPGRQSLREALAQMPPEKVMLVCLMDGYRGNGPYNDFMHFFRNVAKHAKPFLYRMHIITMNEIRKEEYSWYFEAEDKAREERLPFDVLHDEDETVTDAFFIDRCPFTFAVTADGTIISADMMESPDFWNALAKAAGAGE